jgi:hypothetical protein
VDRSDDRPPLTLDYGASQPPVSARRVFACICGIAVGIWAVPALLFGIMWGVVAIFLEKSRGDIPADWVKTVTLLCIALVCGGAAFRWIRFARRG